MTLGIYLTKAEKRLASTFLARLLKMTASRQAKELGLKSLTQVSELTGQSLQTLTNWFNDKPELFRIVLIGCKASLDDSV